MTEVKEKHPEGIEVAFEILRNVPPDVLDVFLNKLDDIQYIRNSNLVLEVWHETLQEWYDSIGDE